MLPQNNRLQKKKDIEAVFKKGKSFREESLVLKAAENGLNVSRFGFVVSKKISGKAVERNKIRRKLSEVIRLNSEEIKKGFDILLIAIKKVEVKKIKELESLTGKLFKKADLLN